MYETKSNTIYLKNYTKLSSSKIKNVKWSSSNNNVVKDPVVFDEYEDKYKIDGIGYTLKVQFVDRGMDLFWVDVSHKAENIIICQVNTGHVFFQTVKKPASISPSAGRKES